MQDAFLQAFIALDRLRDPGRFAGWLGGIVANAAAPSGATGSLARSGTTSPPSPEPATRPATGHRQVPADAISIIFGVVLNGRGQIELRTRNSTHTPGDRRRR